MARRNPRDNFPFPTWQEVVGSWGDYWSDWMYGSSWDADKYDQYAFYKSFPLTSSGIAIAEGRKDNEEYMSRYNLTWDDIFHAERLPGTAKYTSGVSGVVNFTSHNITRLYK